MLLDEYLFVKILQEILVGQFIHLMQQMSLQMRPLPFGSAHQGSLVMERLSNACHGTESEVS